MSSADLSGLRSAADVLWRRVPEVIGRLSPTLRVILRDGDYARAWPAAGVAAPPAALLLGLILGASHPGPVYSSSVTVLLLLAAVSGLGAAYGLWALLGYAAGDFFLHDHGDLGYYSYYPNASTTLLHIDVALIDSYLILAGLLVVAPLVAIAAGRQSRRLLRSGRTGEVIGLTVAAVIHAVLGYFWAQSTAFLIRPLWSFVGSTPDIGSISPLQQDAGWLGLVAAAAVMARAALTLRAVPTIRANRSAARAGGPIANGPVVTQAGQPFVRFTMDKPRPWVVGVLIRAALFTFLLAGLLASWSGALLLFAVLAGLGAVQYGVIPRWPGYLRMMTRIPLLVRVVTCCLIGYVMSSAVVQPALDAGEASFVPMLTAVVPPLLAAALLLPGQPRPGRVTR
jgi:hypothetical protein